jgi:hypothetical protein
MPQGKDLLVDCFLDNFMCFHWEHCLPLKGGKCFVSLTRYLNVNVVGNVLGVEKWDG